MAQPADLPDFATDANYTNGPDVGTPTKVEPSAGELAEGNIRATAPAPQKFNWWMNLVGLWIRWFKEALGVADGIATLDGDGQLPVAQLPEEIPYRLVASYEAGLDTSFQTSSTTEQDALSVSVLNCAVGDVLIIDASVRADMVSSTGLLYLSVLDGTEQYLGEDRFVTTATVDHAMQGRYVVVNAGTRVAKLRVDTTTGTQLTVHGNPVGSGRRSKLRVLHFRP